MTAAFLLATLLSPPLPTFGGAGLPGKIPPGPMVLGAMPKELIQKVVAIHRNQMRYCYEVELSRAPSLAGRVTAKFVIGANGRVASARIAHSTLSNANVERCIVAKIKTWKFPATTGGMVEVSYPFEFRLP